MPRRSSTTRFAVLIALSAAFLLCGYEFVRSASNTLYKAAYGTENLPVIMALVPLGVLVMLYAYGKTLTRLGPRRTLLATSLACGLVLLAATFAVGRGSRVASGVLYVVREAYIVLLLEQYWSLINSTMGEKEARRLNGPIIGIASLGAILGGRLVGLLAERLGTATMPYFAAAATLPAAILSDMAYAQAGETRPTREEAARHDDLGLRQFRGSRLLLCLLLIIVVTQVVSTAIDLSFQNVLQREIPAADRQTAYSGEFFSNVNLAAAVLQFVVAPLLLRWLPLTLVHLAIPCVHIVACGVLFASPSLGTAGAAYLLFKSLDYSVFKAAKEILYIPLPFDTRYRAKEIIDVFCYRFSKGAVPLSITLLRNAGVVIAESAFAATAAVAACIWLGLVVPLMRSRVQASPQDVAMGREGIE